MTLASSPASLRNILLLSGFYCALLLIFYSGHIYSDDTATKITSAKNFVSKGSFAIEYGQKGWGVYGKNNKLYPLYSIGSIVHIVPAVICGRFISIIVGKRFGDELIAAAVTFQNLLYCVAIAILLWFIALKEGLLRYDAFIFSLMILFCSQLLQYSHTGWSEPGALFWSMLGFYLLFYSTPNWKWRFPLWIIFSGISVLIRIEHILFYIIFSAVYSYIDRKELTKIMMSMVGLLSIWSLHFLFNIYRFGHFLKSGYIKNEDISILHFFINLLSNNFLGNVYGFFLSFGKYHWFWVSPLLIIVPYFAYKRKNMGEPISILFWSAIIYSPIYIFWIHSVSWCCTSWCWGYRFFTMTFPFLLLPVIHNCFTKKINKIFFRCLIIIATLVQIIASLVNYHLVLELLSQEYGFKESMWGRGYHFLGAPFLKHCMLFPQMVINTIKLAFGLEHSLEWGFLRAKMVDIWPVGLSAIGVMPQVAFALWLMLVILTIVYAIKIVMPILRGIDAHY